MKRFYLSIWLYWSFRVILCSVLSAALLSSLITAFIYFKHAPTLEKEVLAALFAFFKFWFLVTLNITILFALFRSIKYIFNRCFAGYSFRLFGCSKEENYLEVVGYGDLVKFWRKWFMFLIWISAALMVLNLILFDFYNVYVLYCVILISGYFSFILIGSRCKLARIMKC